MRRLGGQALRGLRRLLSVLFALLILGGIGLGWLAWRLNEGPLDVPALARLIERMAPLPEGVRVEVGGAAIAWEGWQDGAAALDVRLTAVRLLDTDGAAKAELPDAAVSFSGRALLRGVLAPARIEIRRPVLRVVRHADGGIDLDLGVAEAKPEDTAPAPHDVTAVTLLRDLMQPASEHTAHGALQRLRLTGGVAQLLDAESGRRFTMDDVHLDIRRMPTGGMLGDGGAILHLGPEAMPVRLTAAAFGAPLRLSASISLPALHPARLAEMLPELAPLAALDAPVAFTAEASFDADGRPLGLEARLQASAGALVLPGQNPLRLPFETLSARLAGGAQRLRLLNTRLLLPGGVSLEASGEAALRDALWQGNLQLDLSGVDAQALPQAWPEALAPEARAAVFAALPAGRLDQARLQLDLTMPEALDHISLRTAQLATRMQHAVLRISPQGVVRAARAEVLARYAPGLLVLDQALLHLAPAPNGLAPPRLLASGQAQLAEGEWRAALQLGLDSLDFADLAHYWPEGVARDAREWMTENITTGTARNGRWQLTATLPESLSGGLAVQALDGSAEFTDATVHWLRPAPPAEAVRGNATFSLGEIAVNLQGGRQRSDANHARLDLRGGTVRINISVDPELTDIGLQLAGPLTDIFTVLRHPRLKLFDKRPLPVNALGGQAELRLDLAFPMIKTLQVEQLSMRASARATDLHLSGLPMGQELDRATAELTLDNDGLRVSGQGLYGGVPVRMVVEEDFRPGPPTQVMERATISGRPEARQLGGFNLGFVTGVAAGPIGMEVRAETRRNGQTTVGIRADLRETRLALRALNWSKPANTAASFDTTLRIQGDTLRLADALRLEAPGLSLRGRASFAPGTQLDRVEITEASFTGSRAQGEVRPPSAPRGPWSVVLRGPVLDLRQFISPPPGAEEAAQRAVPEQDGDSPPLAIDLRFDRATMGEGRNLRGVAARLGTDRAGLLREASVTGRTSDSAGFELVMVPQGARRQVRLTADDGGALLRALDLVDSIQGGRLTVNASYPDMRAGAPLIGTAVMDEFVLHDAPAMGKVLQAMTLYGLAEAMRGPGLTFSRLVAPFALTADAFAVNDARAFSASLGVTAKGRILRRQPEVQMEGTIVPAYLFNTLLGNLPLIGRFFSPEAGGGVFAATYRMQGPTDNPRVTMNPLAALTPGFLRGLFGLAGEATGPNRSQESAR